MKRISKGRQNVIFQYIRVVCSIFGKDIKNDCACLFSAFSPREIPLARDARTPQRLALLAQNEDR